VGAGVLLLLLQHVAESRLLRGECARLRLLAKIGGGQVGVA
jgi:hypothetical protein